MSHNFWDKRTFKGVPEMVKHAVPETVERQTPVRPSDADVVQPLSDLDDLVFDIGIGQVRRNLRATLSRFERDCGTCWSLFGRHACRA
jgi:hypothetical protein